jgi:hypothetical protein
MVSRNPARQMALPVRWADEQLLINPGCDSGAGANLHGGGIRVPWIGDEAREARS